MVESNWTPSFSFGWEISAPQVQCVGHRLSLFSVSEVWSFFGNNDWLSYHAMAKTISQTLHHNELEGPCNFLLCHQDNGKKLNKWFPHMNKTRTSEWVTRRSWTPRELQSFAEQSLCMWPFGVSRWCSSVNRWGGTSDSKNESIVTH